ncbi:unnamed protein product [Arctia plantaginis]|uniref:Uncharacterized protein n=1 Tax=Arctia plantaginis TaxID=874455 RepID=A0A8S1AAC4_ARCPL|nr:unnamed protein product [Arctia plantaginis]
MLRVGVGVDHSSFVSISRIGEDDTIELDENILSALGQTTSADREYGENIHPEILKRIENILKASIKNDVKEELLRKILIPNNIKLLDAPKLNIELQGLLSDTVKGRDKRVEDRQQRLGIAISGVLNLMNTILKDNFNKINMILSDSVRLLSDLHFEDSITRRKLISPNLDKNISKAIESTARDSFLFGEKFNETVKSANRIGHKKVCHFNTEANKYQCVQELPNQPLTVQH